ncbi:hypothetical protein CDO73_00945 [Saccharibacillus sp. O23]|uniref:hypothetical protein n=1 Tax=Saccharibacillus sp. O23 TaxID=2009338 RepID=UPI000B4E3D8C|nr:hypothetical protein [Saccharibacillus sp. O23]OWR33107.1 hypothetical protein CDO73_00945 [Saccharibacillus sp. O23]
MNGYSAIGAGRTAYSPRDAGGGDGRKPERNGSRNAAEEARWTELMSGETLPDDFTARLMAELEGVEIEAAEATESEAKSNKPETAETQRGAQSHRRRARRKHLRRKRAKIWTATALALLLAGGALLYTQPSIAERVMSLFAPELMLYPDKGMKDARDAGLLEHPEVGAEMQGYKVSAEEVIADSNRIVIGISAINPDGSPYLGELHPEFRISDGNYNLVPTSGGEYIPGSMGKYNIYFARPVLTDTLIIEVKIDRLETTDASGKTTGTIYGSWGFSLNADLSKAATLTIQTPIKETYTTPQGLTIDMLGATRTPSGGSLEYETSLTPEKVATTAGGAGAYHRIDYHLEDAKGNMIANSSTTDKGNLVFDLDRWSRRAHWYDVLEVFPYNKQPLRFVLDSYTIREKSDASVSFDPSSLSDERPATFKDSGDDLKFTQFRIDKDRSVPKAEAEKAPYPKEGVIKVSGVNNGIYLFDKWIALDDKGKSYEVYFNGGLGTYPDAQIDGEFVVKGLSETPAKLTLKRIIVDHTYRDGNWSFEIPQTGTPGLVTE